MRTIGDYEVLKEIGRGPRSTHYLAKHRQDGREVILKEYVIPADTPDDFRERYIARYLDECEWLKGVKHPNIIRVIEVIQPNPETPVPILVVEKLEKSLQRILLEGGMLDPQEVMAWMVEVLSGIREFHKHQIVHRDIKPSNIMFNTAGRPKIIDLSIAVKVGQEITLKPEDISTQYAAPEMYRGRSGANFSSDIYSTGFMVYELICGEERYRRQFADVLTDDPRESLLRWMNWHCDETSTLRPLHEIMPEVPRHISDVIAKMTAKNLAERYQTVREVLEDLFQRSYQQEDAFSLIISQYVTADYWRDQDAYKLNIADFTTPEPAPQRLTEEEPDEKPEEKPKPKKSPLKWVLIGAVAVIWLVGGVFGWMYLQNKKIEQALDVIMQQAVTAYQKPDYPLTGAKCEEAINYIKQVNREKRFQSEIAGIGLLAADAKWIAGLEAKLKEAAAESEAGHLEQALQTAQSICEQKYDPAKHVDKLTSPKFAALQKSACDLVDQVKEKQKLAEAVTQDANACADKGKFRQALYVALTGPAAPATIEPLLQRLEPVVKALDEGRSRFDAKKFVEAREAFQKAWDRSGQRSLEAGYYLQQANLRVLGSLDPTVSPVDWQKIGGAADSVERSLGEAMAGFVKLLSRKDDLRQEDVDPDIKSLRDSSDGIKQRILARSKEEESGKTRFFDPQPVEQIKYPIEDSKKYFADLAIDLACLELQIDLALGNAAGAKGIFDETRALLSPIDQKYYAARLGERTDAGGSPEEAVQVYEGLLADCPHWAECLWRLGRLYYEELKDFDKGIQYLTRATQVLPDNERYRWWAARVAEEHAADLFNATPKDTEGTRKFCEAAMAFWPDFPCALYGLAASYAEQKDADKACEYAERFERAYKNRKYQYTDEDDCEQKIGKLCADKQR